MPELSADVSFYSTKVDLGAGQRTLEDVSSSFKNRSM